jgi:predicted MFS family arabinose efflux permease
MSKSWVQAAAGLENNVAPMNTVAGSNKRLTAWRPLALPDFRLLWIGQTISILGDQFYLVALPWLILQLTGSGLKLGAVLLAATVPRVVFQLVGGAVSDRISPHKLMLVSNILRGVVCVILTALATFGLLQLWHLFVLAAAFGAVDAFFYPALRTFIPNIIQKEQLAAGNALLQGSQMLVKFIGPSLAGVVIAAVGIGAAFGFDTASFVIAALCLVLMKHKGSSPSVLAQTEADGTPGTEKSEASGESTAATPVKHPNLFASIGEGLKYTFRDPVIRSLLIMIAVIEFAFAGPFTVGLASLVNDKLGGGSTAFGALLSAFGGGLLVGTMLAGSLKRSVRLGMIVIPMSLALSVLLLLLGLVSNIFLACALTATMGAIGGYVQVLIAVWLQTKPDPQMRGRVISVVLLCGYGLTPLSYAIAGALTQISVTFMFVATAVFLLVTTVVCALSGFTRGLSQA